MKLLDRFLFKYIHRHWNIGIAKIDAGLNISNIHWMKHGYTDRWFADPFLLNVDNHHYYVLAEEFIRDKKRARLARLIIDKRDCRLTNNETILDLASHLSFPFFVKGEDGKYYVIPENGEAGKTMYYEYNTPLKCIGEFSPLPLADAIIEKINNHYFLFFTLGEECNGNILNIFSSENLFGPYHSYQEIIFKENIARRAGRMFKHGGRLISPAQVCNQAYGEALSLQEVSLQNGLFVINEIKRIHPISEEYPNGIHTLNILGDDCVIDGYKYNYPLVSKLYLKIRKGGI